MQSVVFACECVWASEECVCVGGGGAGGDKAIFFFQYVTPLQQSEGYKLYHTAVGGEGGGTVKKENGWETKGQWRSSVKSYA